MALPTIFGVFMMKNNESINAKDENFIEKHTTPVAINPEILQSEVEIEIPSNQDSFPNEKNIEVEEIQI